MSDACSALFFGVELRHGKALVGEDTCLLERSMHLSPRAPH
jgi:hypothetical protein